MNNSGYVPTLDGWRAVAILLVLGAHSEPLTAPLESTFLAPLLRVFRRGTLGVDIFFTLSGFLIGSLLLREKLRTGRIAVGTYLLRRAFRIFPALWVYLGCIYLLVAAGTIPPIAPLDWFATVAFFRNYISGSWYTGHTWSLSIEIHFYILAPLILALFRPRRAALILALLSILVVAGRALELRTGWLEMRLPKSIASFRTNYRIDELLNGLLLALAIQNAAVRAWLTRHLTTVKTFLLLAIAVALLTVLGRSGIVRVGLAAPLIIAHTILRPNAILGRILEWTPLRWLGLVSYSLYIWQQLFLAQPGEMATGPLRSLQQSIWSLPMALIFATASMKLVEVPMTQLGRRWTRTDVPMPSLDERASGMTSEATSLGPEATASPGLAGPR